MKVNNNHPISSYNDFHTHTKEAAVSFSEAGRFHSYDEITIHSDDRRIAEHTFLSAVAREVSSQAERPVSEERVAALKEQVASNSYHVDPLAVAARMLLL